MSIKLDLSSMSESTCIFCKIVSGEIPTTFVAQTETTLAFWDIAPLAKVHLLVIPRAHHKDVAELAARAPQLLSDVMRTATELATKHTSGSFKLQFNTGEEAGQTVFHAHAHIISDSPKAGS